MYVAAAAPCCFKSRARTTVLHLVRAPRSGGATMMVAAASGCIYLDQTGGGVLVCVFCIWVRRSENSLKRVAGTSRTGGRWGERQPDQAGRHVAAAQLWPSEQAIDNTGTYLCNFEHTNTLEACGRPGR